MLDLGTKKECSQGKQTHSLRKPDEIIHPLHCIRKNDSL